MECNEIIKINYDTDDNSENNAPIQIMRMLIKNMFNVQENNVDRKKLKRKEQRNY